MRNRTLLIRRVAAGRFRGARPESADSPGRGRLLVGAASVDITPTTRQAMAGYSSMGHVADRVVSRLSAHCVYIQGADGAAVVVCAVDLMTATRYLQERIAARMGADLGLGSDQLILSATHTHNGPGNLFGSTLYDTLAQSQLGFDVALANGIADRIAGGIRAAAARARPAAIGCAQVSCWGVMKNASLSAFRATPESGRWNSAGQPGAGAPGDLSDIERAVDPRMTVLAAVDDDGALVAALGVMAGHATAGGPGVRGYSADWPGVALGVARAALKIPDDAVLALLSGAGSDLNTLCPQLPAQGPAQVQAVGERVGQAFARAVPEAVAVATPDAPVWSRWATVHLSSPAAVPRLPPLADQWCFGTPALGGQEDGRSALYHLGLARPGMTSGGFGPDHPQHPKSAALGPLQRVLRRAAGLRAPPEVLLHAVQLGDLMLTTVPGEPTVVAGLRLCAAVAAVCPSPPRFARTVGTTSGYIGYVTTPEAYALQHYEGASTLFGRHTLDHICGRLVDAVSAPSATPIPTVPQRFHVRTRRAGRPLPER